jgi:hypothetical protein
MVKQSFVEEMFYEDYRLEENDDDDDDDSWGRAQTFH